MEELQETASCCKSFNEKKSNGIFEGIIYGLIPHTGCIAFIIFSILGITTLTSLFKPLLMNRYFFYMLIFLSFIFATISVLIYLKKNGLLSFKGLIQKWKYLSVLYGTTIGVNIVLFTFILPLAANMTAATPTGAVLGDYLSNITLKVDIPCPGHAPLISEELNAVKGVNSIKFRFPDYFDVTYDSSVSSKEDILSLDLFNSYPAEVIREIINKETINLPKPAGCSRCGSCNGACGGACGG